MTEDRWTVLLHTGEEMEVFRLGAPGGELAREATDFMYVGHPEYTNCSWHVNCRRIVAGDFLTVSRDVFFLGLLDGEIVGTCWYATPTDTGEVATFGRVVTAPPHRRKGISAALCGAAVEDFRALGGWCMYLGTGLTNPARFIYEKLGFVHYNFIAGGGTIMRNVLRGEADRFEEEYFEPGWPVTMRALHWGDFPRVEVLYNLPHWYVKDTSLGIYANTPFEGQFFDLMGGLEQRQETGLALTTEQGRLVGLAYGAATRAGAGAQDHLRLLEFMVHPAYAEHAPDLLLRCVEAHSERRLAAYASAVDVTRCEALEEAGFDREAVLQGWLQDAESEFDLYVYTHPG